MAQIPVLSTPSGSVPIPVKPRGTPMRDTPQVQVFDAKEQLKNFWPRSKLRIECMDPAVLRDPHRLQDVPLARVKKIMKLDDDVKQQMISAEAPVLFSKAAELFIEELTLRSWVHTEMNKRKTLQKNDISMAIAKCDQFDFLIDIVPREEIKANTIPPANQQTTHAATTEPPPMQYYVQLPSGELASVSANNIQQGIPVSQQSSTSNLQFSNGNIVQATAIGQPIQLSGGNNGLQLIPMGGGNGQPMQFQILQQPEDNDEEAPDLEEEGNIIIPN